MKVGDLVTYGDWYLNNTHGKHRFGIILEGKIFASRIHCSSWFVMWFGHESEWEEEEDLEVVND